MSLPVFSWNKSGSHGAPSRLPDVVALLAASPASLVLSSESGVFANPADVSLLHSESTSIPKNPRTDRPVGYAFVDLSTPSEAERAISELSGKEILERKVSVQLARKPEPAAEKVDGAASGGEGLSGGEGRRRQSGRGRGRGRGRGGRGGRNRGEVNFPMHSLNAPANHSLTVPW